MQAAALPLQEDGPPRAAFDAFSAEDTPILVPNHHASVFYQPPDGPKVQESFIHGVALLRKFV